MGKRLVAGMLCIMLLLAVNVSAFAEEKSTETVMQPMYTYINSVSATLSISSGTAKVYSSLTGTSGVTKVVATAELQQQKSTGWAAIESWTQTTSGSSATLSKTGTVTSGYYYRVVVNYTVYTSSGSESATKTSNQVHY